MATMTPTAESKADGVPPAQVAGSAVARTLSATASFLLTENGRKASLLAGGDGHALQQITVEVPATRLHLVSVDKQGIARLRLRPRYESEDDRGIVRIDAPPGYDEPPTIDDLYRVAAKNHELEARYFASRDAAQSKQRETDHTLREAVAEGFLRDKSQRAVRHPSPTPKRCLVQSDKGRVLFDIATDSGHAKDVPLEAYRRFRADLRERDERNRQQRAEQLALHEEKKRYIAEWISVHGTDEQKVRQSESMLPIAEAVEAITDHVFKASSDLPRYVHDGAVRLQTLLRQSIGNDDIVVNPGDLTVRSVHAVKATAAQWSIVRRLRVTLPDANVILREHVLSSKRLVSTLSVTVFGALVTYKYGPFVLRREFVVDETGVDQ